MAVSIALKNLFESRVKFILSTGGITLAILLILVLDGIFAGAMKKVVAYMENTPFDIVISQQGVKNMHMSTSFFPALKDKKIEKIEGVKNTSPILYSSDYLIKGNSRNVAYIIGFKQDKIGGPWVMQRGTKNIKNGEIIIDERIADKYDLKIGETITTFGANFKIGGITKDTVNVVNSIAFIRYDDFEKIRNLQGVISYDLVTINNDASVQKVIKRIKDKVKGVTVLTRSAFTKSEQKVISDMSIDIMRLMNSVAFLIGLAALGLSVYIATLSKLREYGILKALGSKNSQLISIVFKQAIVSTLVGFLIAIVLALIVGKGLTFTKSNIIILISSSSIMKVLAGALAINILAASIPIIRIAGLNPQEIFRK